MLPKKKSIQEKEKRTHTFIRLTFCTSHKQLGGLECPQSGSTHVRSLRDIDDLFCPGAWNGKVADAISSVEASRGWGGGGSVDPLDVSVEEEYEELLGVGDHDTLESVQLCCG